MDWNSQVTHFLTAGALADEPLHMLSHVFPVFTLASQLCHGSLDAMVPYDLIMHCDENLVDFFRHCELFMEV